MRGKASTMITSIGLVVAVGLGVFASASFATAGLVTQQSDVPTDDAKPMAELRTRGGVKPVVRNGVSAYRLDFTAVFTPPPDSENRLGEDGWVVPTLTMVQAVEFPTVSGDEESVGPLQLPFTSETLALKVVMNEQRGDDVKDQRECFAPAGRKGYRMKSFDANCVQAWLTLGGKDFRVTELFMDVDSSLMRVGKDGAWMWRTKAIFEDPGYAFPIVSLGQGGSTNVWIGDMYGRAEVGKVSFGGNS